MNSPKFPLAKAPHQILDGFLRQTSSFGIHLSRLELDVASERVLRLFPMCGGHNCRGNADVIGKVYAVFWVDFLEGVIRWRYSQ